MNERDPGFERSPGVSRLQTLAVNYHGPLVRDENAGEHSHQRRLAGAVLSDEAVNLPWWHRDADIINCDGTPEAFDNAAGLDDETIPAGGRRVLNHGAQHLL